MKKEAEFPNTIIAITYSGKAVLVDGSDELYQIMDGDWFEDNTQSLDEFPTVPGVYRCTIEYYFAPGFIEGWSAPGESDWDLKPVNVVEIDLPQQPDAPQPPAAGQVTDTCGNCRQDWPCNCLDPIWHCGICGNTENYCRCARDTQPPAAGQGGGE